MEVELWKPVLGFENNYEVSNYGQVRSLDRFVRYRKYGKRRIRGQILTPTTDQDGYQLVSLCKEKFKLLAKVHRIVLQAFVGIGIDKTVTRHKDGNPKNNRLDNLLWGTPTENIHDRFKHGTDMRADRNGRAKLTREQVRLLKSIVPYRGMIRHFAKKFSVCESTISRVIHNQAWEEV